ncbi:MAG: ParB/RepB/Spo0J family partition protein [Thermomicrobiales bacterium]|nr:ParB/RepB/Spo0J family partition protein [Thermomicrobiales bacterium]
MTERKRRFTVESLFTDTRPQAAGVSDLPGSSLIALDRIDPDPDQPRRTFDPERLEELASSIRIEGILQPIVVRYAAEADRYIVVHGERRWRASQLAGLTEIPALVREVPADRRLIQQLMENIVRDDLNAVDRSLALRALKEQLGDPPWEAVAEAVGIKRSRLFQLLSTGKLPEPIQEDIRSGRVSEKQSRALQNLDPLFQLALRDAIIATPLSAERAASIARELRSTPVPEDESAAQALIQALLQDDSPIESEQDRQPEVPARELLALLTQVAHGDRNAAAVLADGLSSRPLPRFSASKLEKSLRVQAELLAALHSAPRKQRDHARPDLIALRNALDALLNTE